MNKIMDLIPCGQKKMFQSASCPASRMDCGGCARCDKIEIEIDNRRSGSGFLTIDAKRNHIVRF